MPFTTQDEQNGGEEVIEKEEGESSLTQSHDVRMGGSDKGLVKISAGMSEKGIQVIVKEPSET